MLACHSERSEESLTIEQTIITQIIMIKVSNLSKIFRTEEIETTALNGVSFEIKDGEFVAIIINTPTAHPRNVLSIS